MCLNHSGLEMGQGINTKVAQAVAMKLGETACVPINLLETITPKSTTDFPAVTPTWGSGTSEVRRCGVNGVNGVDGWVDGWMGVG